MIFVFFMRFISTSLSQPIIKNKGTFRARTNGCHLDATDSHFQVMIMLLNSSIVKGQATRV